MAGRSRIDKLMRSESHPIGTGTARMDRPRQTLLIDADDTLWENNVHFERAIEEFLDYLDHAQLSRSEVRAVLNEFEHATTRLHGYGAAAFTRTLRACYEHLRGGEIGPDDLRTVMDFGERILREEIDLLPGVESTLLALAQRHELTLFTKGHFEEQRLKIERSGIGHHFARHEIVAEKDAAAYLALVARLGADPARTWMIGNSPKSDINPALAAGLGAVFIPHSHTWALELAELNRSADRLLVVERFSDLPSHF